MASKFVTSSNAAPCSLALATIASPRGCSDATSRLAARRMRASASVESAVTTSVTTGVPFVIVPVLSKTTIFTWLASSNASPLLRRIPFSAPLPVPTMIAVGVASPNAHGQAMTRTEMVIVRANTHDSCPRKYQASPETRAKTITIGTNTPETLSASLAIGALDPCACSTN